MNYMYKKICGKGGAILSLAILTSMTACGAHNGEIHTDKKNVANQKVELSEAGWKKLEAQCSALNALDLESVGDQPARIVKTKLVRGKKAPESQSIYFKKRGHSQGNPMPAEEFFPDHCLVEGYTTPHVQFSISLPLPTKWNGRFMLAACDAWCGLVEVETPVPGVYRGYATLTNNGGHYSRAPFDGIWAHNDERAVEYFAHRANHVTAQVGKAITKAFYGKAPEYSYITGFSKGGNAGLMAAQRYPDDFDGIFIKAPVVNYNPKNAAHFPWLALAVYPDGKTPVIYADKIDLIHNAVTDACDEIDGLKDRVIDDPRQCKFDPVVLLCKAGQSEEKAECLNMAQVTAVRKIYAKPTTKEGKVYFEYANDFGSENNWKMSILPIKSVPSPTFAFTGAATGVKYMALKDNPGPGYDWTTFNYVDHKEGIDEMSKILDPDSVDLSAFKARGGKIIIVHGWGDGMISANMTIDWFDKVKSHMGKKTTNKFMQLYVVPGMGHGSGGTAPYIYDAQSALVSWVEKGVKPTKLITKDDPKATPYRERPVFPYPAFAKYKGKGDPNLASSFKKVSH